ncbi:MAG TPA: hypothetical protein VM008_05645 [Phycisphaerae bacterium]|nr:hypothetical protein [Phycisphaerae bacterium]
MSQEQIGAENGELLDEFRRLRELLVQEVADVRAQLARTQERLIAEQEESASMRAERDRLRQAQVSVDVRLLQLQKDMAANVEHVIEREREIAQREEGWVDKLLAAQKEAGSLRLELGRTADKLTNAEAVARNAQSQVTQYESAQRAQMSRLGELEPRVIALEEQLQAKATEWARVKAAYDAQSRELIAKRKETEARLNELAGARSRRLLMKLGLVSRCQWEK